jgi:hypothetical protein
MDQRLTMAQIAEYLAECPGELCDLVLELRDLVCKVAGGSVEAIKFGALTYSKPEHPYGSIGGNVCMISWRDEQVQLSFIHGVCLPDPEGLLKGKAKSKRFVEIRSSDDIRRPAVAELIRAAVEYSPLDDAGSR